jgi:hypothetical protein
MNLVMAFLLLACLGLSVGWYLDRTALAETLAKAKYDFLWLSGQLDGQTASDRESPAMPVAKVLAE